MYTITPFKATCDKSMGPVCRSVNSLCRGWVWSLRMEPALLWTLWMVDALQRGQ